MTFLVGLDESVLKKNRALSEDFTKLYLELENEGMFEPSYTHNILRFVELIVMATVGYMLIQCESKFAIVIGSILIGLVQGRSGWMQHESGHLSLSGNPKLDRIFHALFFGKKICKVIVFAIDSYSHTRQVSVSVYLHRGGLINTIDIMLCRSD